MKTAQGTRTDATLDPFPTLYHTSQTIQSKKPLSGAPSCSARPAGIAWGFPLESHPQWLILWLFCH